MGGGNVNYIDLIFFQKEGRDALTVDLNGNCFCTVCFKNFSNLVVARIFDCKCFCAAKKLHQHGIKGFGSGSDYNLLRRNLHIAEGCQIAGNCQAQLVNAADCLALQKLLVAACKYASHYAGPLGKGKALGCGSIVTEIEKEGDGCGGG